MELVFVAGEITGFFMCLVSICIIRRGTTRNDGSMECNRGNNKVASDGRPSLDSSSVSDIQPRSIDGNYIERHVQEMDPEEVMKTLDSVCTVCQTEDKAIEYAKKCIVINTKLADYFKEINKDKAV